MTCPKANQGQGYRKWHARGLMYQAHQEVRLSAVPGCRMLLCDDPTIRELISVARPVREVVRWLGLRLQLPPSW